MIKLSNGYEFTFCCASGALGFTGNGWWWEHPLRWLGIIKPENLTIIAKTVTFDPKVGNLNMFCPWRCVQPIPGGFVNAVGLTNMGYKRWIKESYPVSMKHNYNLIASIQPTNVYESKVIAQAFNKLNLKGIEINISCPNFKEDYNPIDVVRSVFETSKHPIIVKLGCDNLDLIPCLDQFVECFDIINTVPWKKLYPDCDSPLAKYGLVGGISGETIKEIARNSLETTRKLTNKNIISGGGINSFQEVLIRERLGADAFSFGTVFLHSPWVPEQIISSYNIRTT